MADINKHGGDIYSYIQANSKNPIDFSANTNPLGIPKGVCKALKSSVDSFAAYPDINCSKLKDALSVHEGVHKEQIIFGNGAADIIYKICYAIKPENALLLSPTFSEYEAALKNVDCKVNYYSLKYENGFRLLPDFLESIKGNEIIFICNPNNPTGMVTRKELIYSIAKECKKEKCILVIDECFMDFVCDHENYSFKEFLKDFDNVIILKAFTKIYALAGLRLGYCLSSNKRLLSRVEKMGQPWSVSTPAQVAGVAALKEDEYLSKTEENTAAERKYLTRSLRKLGLTVFDSFSNYILFKTEIPIDLYLKLYLKGILIRKCENFKGLDKSYYRIAVKGRKDNSRLIKALSEIL